MIRAPDYESNRGENEAHNEAEQERFDPVSGKGSGRLAQIANPAPEAETDFYSILRALKKDLIIMDVLVFSAK